MYIIYKTTNIVNGKIYIGIHKTKNINDSYLGSGKYLKRAIEKYGKENFKREILFQFEDHEEDKAWEKEKELVNEEFILREDNYNINVGGNKPPMTSGSDNPFYGKTHSDEAKKKMSEKRKGVPLSEEHKRKISIKSKELWADEEHRKNCIKGKIGVKKTYTPEGLESLKNALRNREFSEETKKKISDSRKEFFANLTDEERAEWYKKLFTEERNKKISEYQRGSVKPWVKDKINKNPEKIRKTAEKHRGMKRSDETRKRISEAKKGVPSKNKGKKAIHNPETGVIKYIFESQELPEGFIFGTGRFGKRDAKTKK